jgi:hypothetical protein
MANEAFLEAHMFVNSSFKKLKRSGINVEIHSMMEDWKAACEFLFLTCVQTRAGGRETVASFSLSFFLPLY